MNSSVRTVWEDASSAYLSCPESLNFRRQLQLQALKLQPISPVGRVKLCPWEEVRIEIIEMEIRIGIESMKRPIEIHGFATSVNIYMC